MVNLRFVEDIDADTIFNWRNDPWIVSQSSTGKTITRNQHDRWYPQMLDRSRHLFWIIESNFGEEMGVARVDLETKEIAVITVYLLKEFVGKGRGPKAIIMATNKAFEWWPNLKKINAFIRPDNTISIQTFLKVGYSKDICEAPEKEIKMSFFRKSIIDE